MSKRSFNSLTVPEILALAISLEEEDARIFGEFARHLESRDKQAAERFRKMQSDEEDHKRRLTEMLLSRVKTPPFIRRDDVMGFVERRPLPAPGEKPIAWYEREALRMELETEMFYLRAVARADDPDVRMLLTELAEVERQHESQALGASGVQDHEIGEVRTKKELFLLQIVQPGLVGLMDGSVSTLAPVFAAAGATGKSIDAFLVGLAASVGAAISMGIAEAMSDDGALTGRGSPLLRGTITGLMTFAGGIGHALPFLIPNIKLAFWLAVAVTACELLAISYIRRKYMEMPFWRSMIQVVLGGAIVLAAGILIGAQH
ncbi:MAG: ferritin family protein [Verrucomicrobiia bacterium]